MGLFHILFKLNREEVKARIHKKTLLIKIGLSIFFFIFLLSFVQGNEIIHTVSQVNYFYLLLSFLLIPIMLSTSCLKWKVLLDVYGKPVSFRALLKIYLVGYFFSNLLPSQIGGDVIRSFYSGKEIGNQTYSAVAVFLERFTGVLCLLLLVIFAPLLRPSLYTSPYIVIPAVAAGLLLTILIWIWRVQQPFRLPSLIVEKTFYYWHKVNIRFNFSFGMKLEKSSQRFYNSLLAKLQKFHDELQRALSTVQQDRKLFFKVSALTILFYLLTWLNVYISFLAFNAQPTFLGICALVPTILFMAQLPVTLLGNLGFFESVFVFYFLLIGVNGAETLAMGMLLRLKMLTLGGVGFLVYLFYRQSHKRETTELEKFVEKQDDKAA